MSRRTTDAIAGLAAGAMGTAVMVGVITTLWFALGIVETLYLGCGEESYGERVNF